MTNYQLIVTNNSVAKTLMYDLNGNLTNAMTSMATNTFEWDAADRLTAINEGGTNRSEFTYDGLGRRVKLVEKTNGVVVSTKLFVWCGTELCEERDSTGSNVTKRFFGQGEQISGTNYFFTRDHLGSVREMTDGSGTIHARYDYDPYGRRTKVSGDMDADFAFTGDYYHANSGLYLTLYRAYDPNTGRWISRDPMQENESLNLYVYAGEDPINYIDLEGSTKIKVNGQIWYTPIRGDFGHPHLFQGVDQGPHMHGPNGLKFFPQTGMMLDNNKKWSEASPRFIDALDAAHEAKTGEGLSRYGGGNAGAALVVAGGVLLLLNSDARAAAIKEALCANIEERRKNKGGAERRMGVCI